MILSLVTYSTSLNSSFIISIVTKNNWITLCGMPSPELARLSSKLVTILSHQEDNGTQETLTTRGHPISNSTLFKDRVRIGTDYGLYLSPVQIHDDGRKFTCHIVVRPGRVLRSSTTVKVFGKFLILWSPCHAPVTVPRFFPRQR